MQEDEYYEQPQDSIPKGYEYYIRGLTDLELGEPDKALVMAQKALEQEHSQPLYLHLMIISYMAMGENNQALAAMEIATKECPELENEFLELKASLLIEMQQYFHAIDIYSQLLEKQNERVEYWLKRSSLYAKCGDFLQAYEDCVKAEALQPSDPAILLRKSNMLIHLGKIEEVGSDMDVVIDWGGEESHLINDRLSLFLGLKKYDRAIAYIDRLIAHEPENAVFYYMKHQILMDMKRYEDSLEPIMHAVALKPDDTDYLWMHALNLYALDRVEETLEDCEKLIAMEPKKKEAYIFRCTIHNRMGRYQESLDDARAAIALDLNEGLLYVYEGCNCYMLGQYKLAMDSFDKASELGVKQGKVYHFKSLIYEKFGDMTQSRRYALMAMQSGYMPDPETGL